MGHDPEGDWVRSTEETRIQKKKGEKAKLCLLSLAEIKGGGETCIYSSRDPLLQKDPHVIGVAKKKGIVRRAENEESGERWSASRVGPLLTAVGAVWSVATKQSVHGGALKGIALRRTLSSTSGKRKPGPSETRTIKSSIKRRPSRNAADAAAATPVIARAE